MFRPRLNGLSGNVKRGELCCKKGLGRWQLRSLQLEDWMIWRQLYLPQSPCKGTTRSRAPERRIANRQLTSFMTSSLDYIVYVRNHYLSWGESWSHWIQWDFYISLLFLYAQHPSPDPGVAEGWHKPHHKHESVYPKPRQTRVHRVHPMRHAWKSAHEPQLKYHRMSCRPQEVELLCLMTFLWAW